MGPIGYGWGYSPLMCACIRFETSVVEQWWYCVLCSFVGIASITDFCLVGIVFQAEQLFL